MKLTYDAEVDRAYLQLGEGEVARTEEAVMGTDAEPDLLVDLTEDGRILGVEIANAAARLPVAALHGAEQMRPDGDR